jgi:hypothetical protein
MPRILYVTITSLPDCSLLLFCSEGSEKFESAVLKKKVKNLFDQWIGHRRAWLP